MRAVLSIIAGDPIRVSTSSLALVVIGAVLAGKGQALLTVVWVLALTSCAFSIAFMALAIAAAMAGAVDAPTAAPCGKEANRSE